VDSEVHRLTLWRSLIPTGEDYRHLLSALRTSNTDVAILDRFVQHTNAREERRSRQSTLKSPVYKPNT